MSELVADAAASITDQLTKLREKMIVFCYQLKLIARSRDNRTAAIQATQPKLKRYTELTQQIRQKSKARKALLAEQKNTSKLNLIKQHDLSRQITTLIEELEELRSEKENLLLDLGCVDDAGIKVVQSEFTAMEASLHKLDEQEERYSSGLEEAVQQYKQLKTQASAVDVTKIQVNASEKAATRLQTLNGDRYQADVLRESSRDVARLLGETEQLQSIRELLQNYSADDRRPPQKVHAKDNMI